MESEENLDNLVWGNQTQYIRVGGQHLLSLSNILASVFLKRFEPFHLSHHQSYNKSTRFTINLSMEIMKYIKMTMLSL